MNLTISILYSLQMATFLLVPFLYKSLRPAMMQFYRRMVWHYKMRRMYSLMVFLFLVTVHFYHLTLFRCHYDVIPSTALCYALLSHRIFEKSVRFLQSRLVLAIGILVVAACLFTPHFFMLGMTIGTMMMAAVFYPSLLAIGRRWPELRDSRLVETYFRWDVMEGSRLEKPSAARPPASDAIEDADVLEYIDGDALGRATPGLLADPSENSPHGRSKASSSAGGKPNSHLSAKGLRWREAETASCN